MNAVRGLQTLAKGAGMASMLTISLVGPLLSSRHLLLYHFPGRASELIGAVMLDFLYATASGAILCWLADRVEFLWILLLAATPAIITHGILSLGEHRHHTVPLLLLTGGTLAILLAARKLRKDKLSPLLRGFQTLLLFWGLFGIVSQLELIQLLGLSSNLNPAMEVAAGRTSIGDSQGKVIWIVFDELSFQQTFGKAGRIVSLPSFDRLRAESSIFSDVRPAGYRTEKVIPALMTGENVVDVRATPSGMLQTLRAGQRDWHNFNPADTVFSDARQDGFNAGIAGWYNPYCRLLADEADSCFWTFRQGWHGMQFDRSALSNSFAPVRQSMLRIGSLLHDGELPPNVTENVADLQQIMSAARKVLRDPGLNFVFLHLPLPHPPGIYNRETGKLTGKSSGYIDNLALSDLLLSSIRTELQNQGEWDNATIVIMGDHSWRVDYWKKMIGLTPEESRQSGGRFDDRPAYLVKLPNQHSGSIVSSPFPAAGTRALLDLLLKHRIANAAQLAGWAANAKTSP